MRATGQASPWDWSEESLRAERRSPSADAASVVLGRAAAVEAAGAAGDSHLLALALRRLDASVRNITESPWCIEGMGLDLCLDQAAAEARYARRLELVKDGAGLANWHLLVGPLSAEPVPAQGLPARPRCELAAALLSALRLAKTWGETAGEEAGSAGRIAAAGCADGLLAVLTAALEQVCAAAAAAHPALRWAVGSAEARVRGSASPPPLRCSSPALPETSPPEGMGPLPWLRVCQRVAADAAEAAGSGVSALRGPVGEGAWGRSAAAGLLGSAAAAVAGVVGALGVGGSGGGGTSGLGTAESEPSGKSATAASAAAAAAAVSASDEAGQGRKGAGAAPFAGQVCGPLLSAGLQLANAYSSTFPGKPAELRAGRIAVAASLTRLLQAWAPTRPARPGHSRMSAAAAGTAEQADLPSAQELRDAAAAASALGWGEAGEEGARSWLRGAFPRRAAALDAASSGQALLAAVRAGGAPAASARQLLEAAQGLDGPGAGGAEFDPDGAEMLGDAVVMALRDGAGAEAPHNAAADLALAVAAGRTEGAWGAGAVAASGGRGWVTTVRQRVA